MSDAPIRIVIIDDHPLYREGVVSTLRRDASLQVVAQGETAEDALQLTRQHSPDILLLDLGIPGQGLRALSRLREEDITPSTKIVILTASDIEDDLVACLQQGVAGYIVKGVPGGELIRILKSIAQGETYITPTLAARLLARGYTEPRTEPAPIAQLTPREKDVLRCLANGCHNREIAEQLHLSEKTVKHYITSIFKKLNLRNRVEAALFAQKFGLTKQDSD